MGAGCKGVRETEEVIENRQGWGVGIGGRRGWDAKGEGEALSGGCLFEPARALVRRCVVKFIQESEAHFVGLSSGWSVTIRYSKASPAFSMALTSSEVIMKSVTSAASLMVVTHIGSLA